MDEWQSYEQPTVEAEPLQVIPQSYHGHTWKADGSERHTYGKRLSDGKWFQVEHVVPSRYCTEE